MSEDESTNNVHKLGSSHDTSFEESDFETLVKRELGKHTAKSKQQQNKTKGMVSLGLVRMTQRSMIVVSSLVKIWRFLFSRAASGPLAAFSARWWRSRSACARHSFLVS